jgi:hypothetical protein
MTRISRLINKEDFLDIKKLHSYNPVSLQDNSYINNNNMGGVS